MAKISYIPLSEATLILASLCEENKLNSEQSWLLESALINCSRKTEFGEDLIEIKTLEGVMKNAALAFQEKDFNMMVRPRGFRVQPVGIEEFLESKQYMNHKGSVRPAIKYELCKLFDDIDRYEEILLLGGVGLGKSFLCIMALSYLVYLDSCLLDAQSEYGLSPGSSIMYIIQSVSLETAKRALFNDLVAKLSQSPYFTKVFPFDKKIKSEIRFPNRSIILPISSSEMAALGLTVKACVMSECNYMQVIEGSRLSSDDSVYDQADRNYTTLKQRMRSRFGSKGKMFLDSAVHYPGDFLDRKMEEAKYDKKIMVMKYAHWEVMPPGTLSTDKFLVEVGGAEYSSRLIQNREEAHPGSQVIEVPMDYWRDFNRDVDKALRDFAGVSVASEGSFITDRSLIASAIKLHEVTYAGQKLFTKDDLIITAEVDERTPDYSVLINQDYLKEPSFDDTAIFALHLDIGVSKDSTGLTIGHIQNYIEMPSTSIYNDKTGSFIEMSDLMAPVFCLDGLLRIRPPHGGEVHLDLVRGFAFYLCQILNIKFATMDSFEKTFFIQGFRRLKVRSGAISVVSTSTPYMEWKQAYTEHRIMHPRHEIYIDEANNLEYDPRKDKVDHTSTGSKDITDSAASVVNVLLHKISKPSFKPKREKGQDLTSVRKLHVGRKFFGK